LLFVAGVAAAFYGGMVYQRQKHFTTNNNPPQPSPTPAESDFATKRAAVDADPNKWLADNVPAGQPKQVDAESQYLQGRALMLNGDHKGAMQAFELALNNLRSESKSALPMATEVKLADAAAALKMSKGAGGRTQEASLAEDKAIAALDEILGLKSQAPPK
jgi:hypothetical protein